MLVGREEGVYFHPSVRMRVSHMQGYLARVSQTIQYFFAFLILVVHKVKISRTWAVDV